MDRLGELKKSLLDNSQFEVESDQGNFYLYFLFFYNYINLKLY